MLTYPLQVARESKLFDLIVVSTDDFEIADCSFKHGAVVVPRPLDDGTAGTQEVAARVMNQLQIVGGPCCVIYPCTPLLTVELLHLGLQHLLQPSAKPYARSVGPDGQDAGCYYWGWSLAFRDRRPLDPFNTVDVVLPAERVCDVDTPEDWARAESMYDALRRGDA